MNRSLILRTILLPILLLATVARVTGQGDVPLFLKPDPTSFKVTSVPFGDARLANAADLQYDSNQENMWKWVELRQTFDGYVRTAYVTKGLTVQVGAPVYFVPGDEDAFLTILENSADADVVEAEGDWIRISVNATIPVYFESDTPAATPIVEEPVMLNNDPIQEPIEPQQSYEPESAVAYDDPVTYEPIDLGPRNPYPGEPIDRIIEGKLRAYKPFFSNPWKKPTYKWEILNRKKKRVAFVDPSKLIQDRPLESYDGRQVSLSGSLFQVNKGRDLVIVPNHLTPL